MRCGGESLCFPTVFDLLSLNNSSKNSSKSFSCSSSCNNRSSRWQYHEQTIVGAAGVAIRGSVTIVLVAAAVIVTSNSSCNNNSSSRSIRSDSCGSVNSSSSDCICVSSCNEISKNRASIGAVADCYWFSSLRRVKRISLVVFLPLCRSFYPVYGSLWCSCFLTVKGTVGLVTS